MDEASRVEKVRQHQVAVAKSMGLSPAMLEVLSQTEDWQLREWLYICALDGFPFERLRKHAQSKTDVATLCKEREVFWRERFVQTNSLQKDVEELGCEVRRVSRESKAAREAVEAGMEEIVKRQEREHAEELKEKDAAIQLLQRRVASLEGMLRKLGEERKKSVERPFDETEKNVPDSDVGRERHESEKQQGEPAVPDVRVQSISILQAMANHLLARRREGETKKFIETFVKDGKLKAEQVDFLMECLEEGVSVREMERFTAPGISVDMMRRLKELHKKGG